MSREGDSDGSGPDVGGRGLGSWPGSWGPQWAIVRRELRSLRSEKTIVLAVGIQLFIAAFSSFLVVGLVSMYDPAAGEDFTVDVAVTGDDTQALLDAAYQFEGVDPVLRVDRAEAQASFDRGAVDAIVDGTREDSGRLLVHVTAPDEGLATTMVITQLRDYLEAVERGERDRSSDRLEAELLAVPEPGSGSPYVTFTYTVLLPLLVFLPVFISGSIAVDSLIEERQRGTLEVLQVAPPSLTQVVDAKLLATAGLAPIQAAAWFVLLTVNGTTITHPIVLVVLTGALALVVVGGGSWLALVAPDRRQAQLVYSVAVVGALVVATLLPEHPANTVAKLAVGSPTTTTWLLVAGYSLAGVGVLFGVRRAVERMDPAIH